MQNNSWSENFTNPIFIRNWREFPALKMAAEIRADPLGSPIAQSPISRENNSAKPELLNKIEGGSEEVHAAVLIPEQDGIISISSDRYVNFAYSWSNKM